MNDLDIDLARNTPWVDMSACVKFRLDQPSRLAGHTEHRSRHIAFYYIDSCQELLQVRPVSKSKLLGTVVAELLQTACPSCCQTNSIKASKHWRIKKNLWKKFLKTKKHIVWYTKYGMVQTMAELWLLSSKWQQRSSTTFSQFTSEQLQKQNNKNKCHNQTIRSHSYWSHFAIQICLISASLHYVAQYQVINFISVVAQQNKPGMINNYKI